MVYQPNKDQHAVRGEWPVPTFYLGGQPYVYEHEQVEAGGAELALTALFETYRYGWYLFSEWQLGRVSHEERLHIMVELSMGAMLLRDLIPTNETHIPNACMLIVH